MADSPILLQKDNTFTKLFVGGLPYHTTDETLQAYFQQFGEIEEAVVIHDRITRKSKGYGFVTMADRAGAERACSNPNPVIEGRRANVNLAYIGAKPKNHSPPERVADLVYPNNDSSIAGLQSPTGGDLFSQHSPPPLPFGLQAQGFIVPGPGCPPFSPPPPPMLGPLLYPPYFNPQYGYGPPVNPGPMNFPPQPMPPLVPYNAAN